MAHEGSHPSLKPEHAARAIAPSWPSAPWSLSHLRRPHPPSQRPTATPHPTHAKVLLNTHLCHGLKYPLVTQRHLLHRPLALGHKAHFVLPGLTLWPWLWQAALCWTNPSAKPFSHSLIASKLPHHPLHHSQEASRLCLAQRTLPQGEQTCCDRGHLANACSIHG